MATLTLADISDALSQLFLPNIVDSINTTAIGLTLIPTVDGGGKNAAWTVKFTGRTNAGGYAEGADMTDPDFDSEKKKDGILPWAQYRKGAKLSGLAQAAASSNEQPGSVLSEGMTDLFDEEIGDGVERLALGLGTDLYSGDGSAGNPMIGLEAAIDDSAAVYATIDPALFPEWVSTVQSVPVGDLSFSKIRTYLTAIYNACGKKPDLMLCDGTTFDRIGDLFGDNRREVKEIQISNGRSMGRRTIRLEGGYDVIDFDGIPVARDALCTANTIYALNTRFIHLKQLPAYKSPMTLERFLDIMEGITGERQPIEEMGEFQAAPGQLAPYVEMLGKTGDSDKAQIKSYLQLCVRRRNVHGKLTLT